MSDRPWWKRALLWEIPFLAVLAGFMLWMRMLPYKALVGSGRAYFIGTDPFYHYRETLGIVRAFPRIPRWDPWTYYPYGTATNQFGTLFDWGAAAYVVLTQGKDASEAYVQQVLGAYPAFLGAALVIPFYFLAKRLLGTAGAIIASITVALLPGEFLIRSIAGYSDHHVAEALMALVSILGVYVAAERGHAARDALRDWRNPRGYWKAILFGALGGLALAANFYAWPPALLFLAILTVWLTIVILVENARGNDPRGVAFGASVSFAIAGLMMIPVIETTDIGDFNAYGILQVLAPLGAAAWLIALDVVAQAFRRRGVPVWVLPAIIAGLGVAGYVGLRVFAGRVFQSLVWGLSWVTGIGVPRTILTIAEAREADFFCSSDTQTASCLSTDFGLVPPIAALLLVALAVWTIMRGRHADILLLVWSLVVFNATNTQIRFSYYLAINMALLLGWAAARVAEMTGFERVEAATEAPSTKKAKGRKTRVVERESARSRPLQLVAIASVLLVVLPGNVFAGGGSYPAWTTADIRGADGDLQVWLRGLDWMRENTPDAGVDLAAIIPRPAPGELYDYPPQAYGVLSWWDYGHWIETTALRPPVANPFQQAAPFASLYFTDRDPAQAEARLDAWVQGKGPVRYVWIDDEMATGKYGAITVWANSQDPDNRSRWADDDYLVRSTLSLEGQDKPIIRVGPQYKESMMGRLYDGDGDGLGHYRLVWEHPEYGAIGSVSTAAGELRCVHDIIPSRSCPVSISDSAVREWREGGERAVVKIGEDQYAYDLDVQSRLKLFERVAGARIVGTASPGALVEAAVEVRVQQDDGRVRPFLHTERAIADAAGRFEIVWPYPTTDLLAPSQGGTNAIVHAQGAVQLSIGGMGREVDVPERAVLEGTEIPV